MLIRYPFVTINHPLLTQTRPVERIPRRGPSPIFQAGPTEHGQGAVGAGGGSREYPGRRRDDISNGHQHPVGYDDLARAVEADGHVAIARHESPVVNTIDPTEFVE